MPDLAQEADDAALARAVAAAGATPDRAAEAELCRRFAPRVRLYGLRHLRDAHAAADLVQHVLMTTLERLRSGAVRAPERPRLARCMEALAERERSVLVLSFYAERPAEEAGRELGLSAANVRVIRHRALAKLRDCMTAGGAA